MNIRITGSGCYIPTERITNDHFKDCLFLDEQGKPLPQSNDVITQKLFEITGIEERRYVSKDLVASDIGYLAAKEALKDASINPEEVDYIIFAHNFGDVRPSEYRTDSLPSLANRVKHRLQIKNPKCVAYDILFGCPGWIEGVIQAYAFIKAGMARRCLVIGAETLSRVLDMHDRDSMIYADGAGAAVIEASDDEGGILSYESASYSLEELNYLYNGKSYNLKEESGNFYIKMRGRKIYEFALKNVPYAMKICLDKANISVHQIKKILIHQANEKMDEAIIKNFYKLYQLQAPEGIMPMNIRFLGNSSVATVPTLYDLIVKGKLENHHIQSGDVILFASVGAGMNINAIVYQY
ncbi:MAG: 3-oxoacyl-ACP synthase III family protein [Thermaurantimonas sp.]